MQFPSVRSVKPLGWRPCQNSPIGLGGGVLVDEGFPVKESHGTPQKMLLDLRHLPVLLGSTDEEPEAHRSEEVYPSPHSNSELESQSGGPASCSRTLSIFEAEDCGRPW